MFLSNCHQIQRNCHRIQWNSHRIQWNCHQIKWNCHRIQWNCHRNWKQIGQIVTDFDEWSSKTEANWSKQSPPNTILQSFLYSVKLQLISMNGHRNQKQIGRNNHLQTLFHTHSYVLSFRKKGSAKSNHLQTLYYTHSYVLSNPNHLQTLNYTLQNTSSQAKPRV